MVRSTEARFFFCVCQAFTAWEGSQPRVCFERHPARVYKERHIGQVYSLVYVYGRLARDWTRFEKGCTPFQDLDLWLQYLPRNTSSINRTFSLVPICSNWRSCHQWAIIKTNRSRVCFIRQNAVLNCRWSRWYRPRFINLTKSPPYTVSAIGVYPEWKESLAYPQASLLPSV